MPVTEGFRRIADHLSSIGRPKTAFCACELRSPKPFSFAGFGDFNKGYVAVLEQWGLFRDGDNPVARSNVAPEINPPAEPCFYAFSYTVPSKESGSFIVAGSGEWPEGGRFPEDIVARGDASEAGMRAKADFVLGKMDASRLKRLGRRMGPGNGNAGLYRRKNRHSDDENIRNAFKPAASPGTTAGRRSKGSTSRWTCGASASSACSRRGQPAPARFGAAPRMPLGMKMMNSTSISAVDRDVERREACCRTQVAQRLGQQQA